MYVGRGAYPEKTLDSERMLKVEPGQIDTLNFDAGTDFQGIIELFWSRGVETLPLFCRLLTNEAFNFLMFY